LRSDEALYKHWTAVEKYIKALEGVEIPYDAMYSLDVQKAFNNILNTRGALSNAIQESIIQDGVPAIRRTSPSPLPRGLEAAGRESLSFSAPDETEASSPEGAVRKRP
jgi:hypothetical protein